MRIENKNGKNYICLDRPEYTLYLDEKEVLIQSGLRAKVESIEESDSEDFVTFNLYISDSMIQAERRKRTLHFAFPVLFFSLSQIYKSYYTIYITNFELMAKSDPS